MIYLIGTEYIFEMSRPVYMAIGYNQKCIQIIPSLNIIQKTSIPTSWVVQQTYGKIRFWDYITEVEFNEKLIETLTEIKNV